MPLRIIGMRLGVNVHTPAGNVRNGAITAPEHREYLAGIGYRLQACAGIPEPQLSDEERAEMARIALEQKSLAQALKQNLNELLAPLRKKTYRDQFE